MGCHILCSDGLGRCMAVFVYAIMLGGNGLLFWTVVNPEIGTENEDRALAEYIAYSTLWFMMVISHISTMCIDPGFIPRDYKYHEEALVAPFKTVQALESAFQMNNKRDLDEHDQEDARNSQDQQPGLQLVHEEQRERQTITQAIQKVGLTQKQVQALQSNMGKKCRECNCVKPPRAHHCSDCGRCVLKMDHHCPWMNNCIGLRNQKAFLLFNFYTCLTSAWTTVRVAAAAFGCKSDDECEVFSGAVTGISVIMLMLTAVFTLFTAVMFCDQARMISEGTGTIDRMQARRAAQEGRNANGSITGLSKSKQKIKGCCNISLLCFLPCTFCQDRSVENQLYNDP